MISVEYLGVSQLGPEGNFCAVLYWPEQSRVLPIWVSPEAGHKLQMRPSWEEKNRPDTTLVLADLLDLVDDPVVSFDIVSQYRGVFYAAVHQESGRCFDTRPTDILNLHFYFEAPILVDEEVLSECSVYMTAQDIDRYFDFTVDIEGETWETGKAWVFEQDSSQADAEDVADDIHESTEEDRSFEAFMRELGVSDEDLRGE